VSGLLHFINLFVSCNSPSVLKERKELETDTIETMSVCVRSVKGIIRPC
jgi:hypothetical protein